MNLNRLKVLDGLPCHHFSSAHLIHPERLRLRNPLLEDERDITSSFSYPKRTIQFGGEEPTFPLEIAVI